MDISIVDLPTVSIKLEKMGLSTLLRWGAFLLSLYIYENKGKNFEGQLFCGKVVVI
jgi:hypothetical protein